MALIYRKVIEKDFSSESVTQMLLLEETVARVSENTSEHGVACEVDVYTQVSEVLRREQEVPKNSQCMLGCFNDTMTLEG